MSRNIPDREIEIRTNAFRITQLPTIQYRQYDIIQPEIKNVRRRREAVEAMQNAYPDLFQPRSIYDGRAILFSPTQLDLPGGNTGTLDVSLGNGPRGKYQVKLTLANGVIDFQGLAHLVTTARGNGKVTPEIKSAVNLLQMILRQAASMLFPTKGRSVFTEQDRPIDLGMGVVLLNGFFQSVRPISRSVMVNIDVANSAFYKAGNLTTLAMEVLRARDQRVLQSTPADPNGASVMSILKRHFYRVQIKIPGTSNDKIRTIRGIKENAGNHRFSKRAGPDGQGEEVETTVAEYYREVYNIHIRYPKDFGVIISPPGQPLQVVPFELCMVTPGQPYGRKLDDYQTRKMVEHSTNRPDARLNRIKAAVAHGGTLQYSNSHFVKTAGVQLEREPMKISGTLLAPPTVNLGGTTMNVNNGSWNMLGKRVYRPAPGLNEPWVILNFGTIFEGDASKFVHALYDCCRNIGMSMPPPDLSRYAQVNSQRDDLRSVIESLSRSGPPRFILAILKKSDADTKAKLKHFTDLGKWPMITQCVREDKFSSNLGPQAAKKLNQYCNNVALKINARLGGVNYAVALPGISPQTRHMIVGYDVSHPPGGPRLDRPSVASLVFSTDQYGCRYQARYSVLRPRTEALGEDLKVMIENAIDTYTSMNGPPECIICYRDGISEDELERTGATEIEIIKDTVSKRLAYLASRHNKPVPPSPKLTFIVVTKRHHFGAFAINQEHADRSGNLLPGFATNDAMSTPGLKEFYLLSHAGLLGTSRPAHYVVLRDENFDDNLVAIKKLSFALCHVYAKATRSVSIPAPVYYADLACLRATTYYFDKSLKFDGDDSTVDGHQQSNKELREAFNLAKWQQGFGHPSGNMRSQMYFL